MGVHRLGWIPCPKIPLCFDFGWSKNKDTLNACMPTIFRTRQFEWLVKVFLKRCRNSQRLCQSDSMSTVSRTVRFNAAKYLQTFISLIACLYVWGFFCLWTNTPIISACEVTVRCTAWFIQHCRSQRTVPLPFTKRCVTNVGTRHCHSQNKSEPRKHNFRRFLRV